MVKRRTYEQDCHRSPCCEPLLFFVLYGNPAISDRRVIAICRNRGLRRSSQDWTLIEVIGRLRTAASSIPLTHVSHEAMRVVSSVLSRRSRLATSVAK